MTRILTLFAAALGLLSCAWLAYRMDHQPGPPPPLQEPSPAPFTDFVSGLGVVEGDGGNVMVGSLQSGIVEKIHVKVGQSVRAGDPLFQVDDDDDRAILATREAELAVLDANIRIAQQKVNERRDIAERVMALRADKVNSEVELVQSRFELAAAEAQLSRAQAELAMGKARLNEAKTILAQTLVKAPRDVEVLQINVREGEYCLSSLEEGAMLLGDTRRLQIRVEIDQDSASRIQMSAKAVAQVRGLPGQLIPLEFTRIKPLVLPKQNFTGGSMDRIDTRVLQVVYTFDPPKSPPVYVGQILDVFIETSSPKGQSGTSGPTAPLQ